VPLITPEGAIVFISDIREYFPPEICVVSVEITLRLCPYVGLFACTDTLNTHSSSSECSAHIEMDLIRFLCSLPLDLLYIHDISTNR
jgi:hypothetical protein